ncbi:serine hydrolase domain-containing protein [Streptomyces hainanensis]|uniref:Class A beta-lactamase-related serine hydrolase n=1 Tax=Streptomyces hainanensis TaxID=402648 RepID=A0A4R4T2Z6_9ACTN|nr:serine hydrolase domain-containing protein [Streptomyces hainanensis]TDC71248.1 class A beta-lactamase-related serine hydrolase [Streptomyces hainanensis]
MTTTRRTVLGALGVSVAATGATLAGTGTARAGTARAGTAGATGAARATSGRVPPELRPGGALDAFVAEEAAQGRFSGSVLLTHRGRQVLARSHGMADRERSLPNGPDTLYSLASVTKLFTAVAVAQLAQRGEVGYQATVGTYLDGFPAEVADRVTVHHLLTHTSGLGDTFRMPGFAEESATWDSVEEVMAGFGRYVRTDRPAFAPGAGFAYSNTGFHVLGEIVAAVAGRPYHDHVREHVFRAAGMTGSDFYTRTQWRDDRRIAHPYAVTETGGREDVLEQRLFVGTPAGDAFANCAGLDRFARALTGGELLDPTFVGITLGGKVPPAGPQRPPGDGDRPRRTMFQAYGPMATLEAGQWTIGHNGGSRGIATSVEVFPDTDWVAVVLANYDTPQGVMPSVPTKARELILAAGA